MATSSTPSNASIPQMPDVLIILLAIMLIAALGSHVIPAGYFDGAQAGTMLDPASFHFAEQAHAGVPLFAAHGEIGFLNFAFAGLVSGDASSSAIGVVMFILLTGGAFGILLKTGAIHQGLLALIAQTKQQQQVFIPLLFIIFSLGGAVFGMGEEAIAFCLLLHPLMLALGYDAITTVLVTYVATQIGFATSWMNPFNVAIAQGIAGVPMLSGQGFRIGMWLVFTSLGLLFTVRYAQKVRLSPQSSLCYAIDLVSPHRQPQQMQSNFQRLDGLILLSFGLGLGWIVYGVTALGYYIPELASQFFSLGLVTGLLAVIGKRLTANQVADAFKQGAAELLPAALVVGMAKGVILLLGGDQLGSPSVLNTLLYYAAVSFDGISSYVAAWWMLVLQSVINFFVSSGSGQAALTMPLIAPLADVLGLSRQIAVLAFQLGDGLTNCIIPTSASLIGCLGVVGLPWALWLKFIWRFQLMLFAMASVVVLVAVALQYQ